MRTYRFVNELGRMVDLSGRRVAEAAAVTSSHQGGLVGDESAIGTRVGEELLRQLTRETNGRELERVGFEARSVRTTHYGSGTMRNIFDIAVIVTIDLPTYQSENVVQASVFHLSHLPPDGAGPEDTRIRNRLESLVERTAGAYVFLVDTSETRVIPAQSVISLDVPVSRDSIESHLYGRSIGRFAEELAEGFIGEDSVLSTVPDFDPMNEPVLREWGAETGVDGVFSLRIFGTGDQPESSLAAYIE